MNIVRQIANEYIGGDHEELNAPDRSRVMRFAPMALQAIQEAV